MTLEQEALEFVQHLQTLYFEKRDMRALLPSMMETTSWIGTGAQELCRNLEDAKTALALDDQEYSGSFSVTETSWDVTCLSENSCVVFGEINAKAENPEFADLYNRVTAVCIKTESGIKLSHLHMSNPDIDQAEGRFYVKRSDILQREALRQRAEHAAVELLARNLELEALTENIPGGVHQCMCDNGLTFLNMSHSFINLVGYSPEEIQERFHNRFVEMIYPEDLDRIQAEMEEQLSRGDVLELEYRIMRSDGNLLWILDHGNRARGVDGDRTFYCILIDITKQKEEREDLRLSLERHKIIMDQTTDIIFEWDILKDSLSFSSNWRKKFGYDPIREDIGWKIPLSKNIHPKDMPAFIKIMKDTAAGVPYSETEFRIRNIRGSYIWNRIRATVQYDMQDRPIKAVGVILDIDVDKKQKQRLLELAQRDALTNLYNKSAICELIEQKMEESGDGAYQALLIIDVDEFKSVNDTYGHLCGDSLLAEVAGTLQSHVRFSDLVGRIGGDEFLVYLPEIAGKRETAIKAEALLSALHELVPKGGATPISCSIGVAFFPQGEGDYLSLYKCADIALYQMKGRGKNNYLFYDEDSCGGMMPGTMSHSAVGAIDSEETR